MILERRRMRRRLAVWRVLAILALVVAGLVAIGRWGGMASGPYVARVDVDGIISTDRKRDDMIRDLADDDDARALIIAIDSPGGTVAGSEALYDAIRKVAAKKPVVATMADVAASGGYVTALAADHIVAMGNTLTGSIGVLAETPNVAGLLAKLGVEFITVKSKPLKAEPSMTNPPAPGALEAEKALIDDSYAWFRGLVSDRRGITGAALDTVSDGRAFTGRQAKALGLVDALGGEDAARDWLATKGVSRDLDVRDRKPEESGLPWPVRSMAGALGLGRLRAALSLPQGPALYALMR